MMCRKLDKCCRSVSRKAQISTRSDLISRQQWRTSKFAVALCNRFLHKRHPSIAPTAALRICLPSRVSFARFVDSQRLVPILLASSWDPSKDRKKYEKMRKEKKRCQKSQWNPIGKSHWSLPGVSLESRLYRTAAIAVSHDAEKNLCAAFGFWDNPGELGEKSAAQRSTVHCIMCIACLRVVSVVGSEFSHMRWLAPLCLFESW